MIVAYDFDTRSLARLRGKIPGSGVSLAPTMAEVEARGFLRACEGSDARVEGLPGPSYLVSRVRYCQPGAKRLRHLLS